MSLRFERIASNCSAVTAYFSPILLAAVIQTGLFQGSCLLFQAAIAFFAFSSRFSSFARASGYFAGAGDRDGQTWGR